MKKYKYIGYFNGFQLEVHCIGFNEAYYLLMAKAINEAKNYMSLSSIKDEKGNICEIKKFNVEEL